MAALTIAAGAGAATVTPVMTGLDSPRGLAFGPEGALHVTETGRGGSGPPCRINRGLLTCYGPTGAISRLWRGLQEKWVTGLPSMAGAQFPTGLARIHRLASDGTTSVYATGLTAVVDLAFATDGTLYALQHGSCGPFFACPGSIVRVGASPPHPVVYAGLSRPSAFTIGPDGSFYISNKGASAGIGEVLRIEP